MLDTDELRARIAAADAEAARVGRATEGAPGVFFYAFDRERLLYFAGRTHWRCGGLGCWDYVADHLYAVRRSGAVEAALGVDRTIALYERGPGGMTMAAARAEWGEPDRIEHLQLFGSERWHYPDRTVLFLGGSVAAIEPR